MAAPRGAGLPTNDASSLNFIYRLSPVDAGKAHFAPF
jgi:hypothetical protein